MTWVISPFSSRIGEVVTRRGTPRFGSFISAVTVCFVSNVLVAGQFSQGALVPWTISIAVFAQKFLWFLFEGFAGAFVNHYNFSI